jgi:mRNA interferase MazF
VKEVWKVSLKESQGHEQKGDRPAIVWKDLNHVEMVIVIPFTTNLEDKKYPYTHRISATVHNGLSEESIAMIYQIKSLDKKRLLKKLGELEEDDVKNISAILKDMLKF